VQPLQRIGEGVQREVVEFLEFAFKPLAVRAIRIGEHGQHALTRATNRLDGIGERQLGKRHALLFLKALGRQVALCVRSRCVCMSKRCPKTK